MHKNKFVKGLNVLLICKEQQCTQITKLNAKRYTTFNSSTVFRLFLMSFSILAEMHHFLAEIKIFFLESKTP